MRLILAPLALILFACGTAAEQPAEQPASENVTAAAAGASTFIGSGRNRLCLDERNGRAGFITYGSDDRNCSVTGAVQQSGAQLTITPDGDQQCRIEATVTGGEMRLGQAAGSCSYYCAPGASFAGKSFRRGEVEERVADLAGDPLC